MHIQQHYRYGKITSSHIDTQDSSLSEDAMGWLRSQLHTTPLVRHEDDGEFYWDPHEISLHEGTLVRFIVTHFDEQACLTSPSLSLALARKHIVICHEMTSEPPFRWGLHHHAHLLPYEGVVGKANHPKRFYFRTYACNPAEAWEKVTSSLVDHNISPDSITLHTMSVGGIPFSLFKRRYTEQETPWTLFSGLSEASKNISYQQVGILKERLDSDLTRFSKKGFDWAFLAGKIMAEYGIAKHGPTGEWIHYGLVLQSLLEGHNISPLPDCLKGDVLYINEENHLQKPGNKMFNFSQQEKKVIDFEPSMRFLVMNNIPLNTSLSLRQKQAWCQFYFRDCA